ncbi:hypothetical protein F4803DRAFT_507180 [Xylaria telfairii]|nr:hypothetical protein F4803DRAFT_507180 [Xylaria telfairii]
MAPSERLSLGLMLLQLLRNTGPEDRQRSRKSGSSQQNATPGTPFSSPKLLTANADYLPSPDPHPHPHPVPRVKDLAITSHGLEHEERIPGPMVWWSSGMILA